MAYTGKLFGNNIHPALETTTLAGIDGRYKVIYANLSSATRLSFATNTGPESGQEYAIVIRNNASSDLNLESILPTGGVITYNGGKTLKKGLYAEAEILYLTGTNMPTTKTIVSLSYSWPDTKITITNNPTNIAASSTSHTITYNKETGYSTALGFVATSTQTGLTNTITITANTTATSRSLTHTVEGTAYSFVQLGVVVSDLKVGANIISNYEDTSKPTWGGGRSNTFRIYSFVPTTSKSYSFAFSDSSYTNTDSYGYLLSESGSILAENDDSNGGSDPLFSYSCTANTKYFYAIGPYTSGTNIKGILTIS